MSSLQAIKEFIGKYASKYDFYRVKNHYLFLSFYFL